MLDIGWQELFLLAVLTLIVVGPKDLPHALKAVTKVVRRSRGLAREFQAGLDDVVREAELEDIREQVNRVKRGDVASAVKREIDPDGDLSKGKLLEDFDPASFGRDVERDVRGAASVPSPTQNDRAENPPSPATATDGISPPVAPDPAVSSDSKEPATVAGVRSNG